MSKTRLDDTRWPLVVLTAVGDQTEAEFEAFLAESDALLRRRQPYGVIFDGRRAAPISPKLRQRMVRWLVRNDALLRFYVVASSVVMSTALQRGVFRAILWMRPLPFPYSIDTSLEDAREFVCARLAARGLPSPLPFDRASVLPTPARDPAKRAGSV